MIDETSNIIIIHHVSILKIIKKTLDKSPEIRIKYIKQLKISYFTSRFDLSQSSFKRSYKYLVIIFTFLVE